MKGKLDCRSYDSCTSLSCVGCDNYKPKEKPMQNKVIFESVKEAEILYDDVILEHAITSKECFINGLKQFNYIRKSELQTLVDEVEEMFKNWFAFRNEKSLSYDKKVINKSYETIQFLKEDHPEFGGKK